MLFWGTVMSTVHLVGWALLAWIPHLWLGCVTEFFAGLGFTSYPILISLCQASLDENSQGVGMGVVFAVKAATNIVGPLFFGLTYANLREGSHFFGGNCPQFPFLIGVALFVYALYVIRWRLQPLLEKGARDGARGTIMVHSAKLLNCTKASIVRALLPAGKAGVFVDDDIKEHVRDGMQAVPLLQRVLFVRASSA